MTNLNTLRTQKRLIAAMLALAVLTAAPPVAAAEPVHLLAAGSLKNAFTEIIKQWQTLHPEQPVTLAVGPAGWLRERIEKGEAFDIYASAALTHAEAVYREGLSGPAVLFARNTLCAQVKADARVNSDSIVDMLLKPGTRIITSTPKSDPGGDYTWEFFRRLESQHPGAYLALTTRAQQLYGAPPEPGKPRVSASALITKGEADAAIAYCSGEKQNENTAIKYIALPLPSPVADYGLTVSNKAGAPASAFALFILSPAGQRILSDYGFVSIGLPSE